ncbi:valine--tRNA ligase [Erysipelotrichaceae bacterium OttesenSCG-928-M19]|nr:valine--tRNA ligase [Erysipelotrichaceae bacterium OttesenSCG-928-M19]
MKELASKYNHQDVEKGKNKEWIEKKYFQEHDLSKEPFCIVIPPPNVTGKLHLGHAWDTSLQDVIIRYKKLQGYDTLWLPGMDHAGIATQAKVDEKLREQGVNRYDLGREKFLEKSWEWKEDYASFIREQWGKLGLALDYSNERFTLDEGLNQAVTKVFVDLYNKGLIYRGERIINWDPQTKTALSNIEVDHYDIEGNEHYFRYYFADDKTKYLEVMTTRPETILGDGAIAINPSDERYLQYLGKEVLVPVSHVKIPIIADDYVSIETGSGCVKITPAHDPNDFNVGVRHDIPFRIIMNDDATMASNEWVPEVLQGLDRFVARKKFIELAKEDGSLEKIVPIVHSVGHSQRSGVIVEPFLSKQWFVKMEPLAKLSIDFQDSAEAIEFFPPRFEQAFIQWMENIEDWCISRQLWWGHRIPAWYHNETGELYVSATPPQDIENWHQDEDVLDTWFSSGLWPFSTLGWPEQTANLQRYYPTATLVTAYDILFFWVARMIFTGLEFLDEKPFNHALIHGLIRDSEGRKMSKSLGNGVDPMDVVEQYGADSLRYFLTTTSSPGQDLRYSEEKVEATWNFINKLWNASRFVMMNLDEDINDNIDIDSLAGADKWILTRLNETIAEVIPNMDKYEFSVVGDLLYNFVWDDYCSWYIEMSKATIETVTTKQVLKYVLQAILKMLNPFMPFVTEEIFTTLTNKATISLENYPQVNEDYNFNDINDVKIAMELITKFRETRLEHDLKKKIVINYELSTDIENGKEYIEKMTNFKYGINSSASKIETSIISNGAKLLIDLSMVAEKSNDELIAEYEIELEQLKKELTRAQGMLSNEKFLAKAPAAKIEEEQAKLKDYQAQYDSILQIIADLK